MRLLCRLPCRLLNRLSVIPTSEAFDVLDVLDALDMRDACELRRPSMGSGDGDGGGESDGAVTMRLMHALRTSAASSEQNQSTKVSTCGSVSRSGSSLSCTWRRWCCSTTSRTSVSHRALSATCAPMT